MMEGVPAVVTPPEAPRAAAGAETSKDTEERSSDGRSSSLLPVIGSRSEAARSKASFPPTGSSGVKSKLVEMLVEANGTNNRAKPTRYLTHRYLDDLLRLRFQELT